MTNLFRAFGPAALFGALLVNTCSAATLSWTCGSFNATACVLLDVPFFIETETEMMVADADGLLKTKAPSRQTKKPG